MLYLLMAICFIYTKCYTLLAERDYVWPRALFIDEVQQMFPEILNLNGDRYSIT
jgi:hypothetical protein